MMEGLLQAITGSSEYAYPASLKKNTSEFRECRIDGSAYIPFDDSATASEYDYVVKNSYHSALLRMNSFAEAFLDPTKAAWLVRVLLDVIEHDTGIDSDAKFYVQSDGSFLSKTDILSASHVELQPFLVGMVHYILTNRSDNVSGQDTLEEWGIKTSERSERKLKKDFPLGKTRTTVVDWYRFEEEPVDDACAETVDRPNSDTERIEAEVVDNESNADGDSSEQKGQSVTVIQQQTNVVQYGDKSISLVNNGTINIDL